MWAISTLNQVHIPHSSGMTSFFSSITLDRGNDVCHLAGENKRQLTTEVSYALTITVGVIKSFASHANKQINKRVKYCNSTYIKVDKIILYLLCYYALQSICVCLC